MLLAKKTHRLGVSLLLGSLTACELGPLEDVLDETNDPTLDGEVVAREQAIAFAPRWENIPTFLPALEIHTCDVGDAGTDDSVQVRVQAGSKLYSYWIDNPGNDFERGDTNTFYLPAIGGGLTQLKDIKSIELEKQGEDGWCIDRVALRMHGVKVWEYAASDTYGGKHLLPGGGNGLIWLDEDLADAPSTRVRWSDVAIKYGDRSRHGAFDIKIMTCVADAEHPNAGTDDDVRLLWTHDGIVAPPVKLDNGGNDRQPGQWDTYRFADYEAVQKITSMTLDKDGTDGWCIEGIRVYANGQQIFSSTTDKVLDGDGEGRVSYKFAADVTVETGTNTGFLGRAYARAKLAASVDASFASTPGGYHPSCTPPPKLSATQLEGMIATMVGGKLRNKAFWGDSGYVDIKRVDGNTVHSRVRFEKDAPGFGNGVFWIDFDIDVKCADPDPTDDDTAERQLMLVPGPIKLDYDLPPIASVGAWFKDTFTKWSFAETLRSANPDLKPQVFDTNKACPGISIAANADIQLDWEPINPANALCRVDSSSWGGGL